MDYQRSTGQQSSNHYDQVQRTPTGLSSRRTVPSSSSRRPVEQRPTGRYVQDQRSTEDSRQSSSSDYSAQRRPAGQSSVNQYGQRSSSNPTNQSDRRLEPYASSRRPVEQRPDDRYGQYQRPVQEGNQRSAARQSVHPSSRNAVAYSPSRSTAEQRPVDRNGQYQPSTPESRPRSTTQSNKSSVSNPDSKKVSRNQSANHHDQYASNKNNNRKFPVKTIIIGVAALVILFVFAIIRMKRDDDNISLPIGMPGEAKETYNYIDDDEIITQELIDAEFKLKYKEMSEAIDFKFKSITVYTNIYDLCGIELKNNLDCPSKCGLDKNSSLSFVDNGIEYKNYTDYSKYSDGNLYIYDYPDWFDIETGVILNDCCILVFEIELNNNNSRSTLYKNNPFMFNLSGIFYLINRSSQKPEYEGMIYFKEEIEQDNTGYCSFIHEIKPGEKHIIHLGFLCKPDNSDKPFSRMGLSADGPSSTYDDNDVFYWFDMSNVISKEKE